MSVANRQGNGMGLQDSRSLAVLIHSKFRPVKTVLLAADGIRQASKPVGHLASVSRLRRSRRVGIPDTQPAVGAIHWLPQATKPEAHSEDQLSGQMEISDRERTVTTATTLIGNRVGGVYTAGRSVDELNKVSSGSYTV